MGKVAKKPLVFFQKSHLDLKLLIFFRLKIPFMFIPVIQLVPAVTYTVKRPNGVNLAVKAITSTTDVAKILS